MDIVFKKKNGKSKRISKELFMKKNMSKKMKGGAFPYKPGKARKLTLMATVTNDTLTRVNQRRIAFGLEAEKSLHITLLEFWINMEHPNNNIFFLEEFLKHIENLYEEIYISNPLVLKSQKIDSSGIVNGGIWEILGGHGNTDDEKFNSKYWARVYLVNKEDFSYFARLKQGIIQFIESKFGNLTPKVVDRGTPPDVQQFTTFSTRDRNELFCLNTIYYDDIATWKPHISILKLGELEAKKKDIYEQLKRNKSNNDEIINILKIHAGKDVESISDIITNRDLMTLLISYSKKTPKDSKEDFLKTYKTSKKETVSGASAVTTSLNPNVSFVNMDIAPIVEINSSTKSRNPERVHLHSFVQRPNSSVQSRVLTNRQQPLTLSFNSSNTEIPFRASRSSAARSGYEPSSSTVSTVFNPEEESSDNDSGIKNFQRKQGMRPISTKSRNPERVHLHSFVQRPNSSVQSRVLTNRQQPLTLSFNSSNTEIPF
jgi:hypothetical protein